MKAYLDDVDLLPSVVPHLKLLDVAFHVLCDSHTTHLYDKNNIDSFIKLSACRRINVGIKEYEPYSNVLNVISGIIT